jgi:AcrR family transcriptional regulator
MNKCSVEETKKKILEAARSVFVEQGYAQASMRLIARAAGISVGGLYLYFRNKEDLYLTFMQDWMKKLNDTTLEALEKIDDPVDAIRAFIMISIDFARWNREIIILQGRELGFTFGVERKREFFRARRRLIADIVSKGIERGAFNACDADEAANVIFNMLRGFIVSMVMDEEALFSADAYADMVLNGLRRRDNW